MNKEALKPPHHEDISAMDFIPELWSPKIIEAIETNLRVQWGLPPSPPAKPLTRRERIGRWWETNIAWRLRRDPPAYDYCDD